MKRLLIFWLLILAVLIGLSSCGLFTVGKIARIGRIPKTQSLKGETNLLVYFYGDGFTKYNEILLSENDSAKVADFLANQNLMDDDDKTNTNVLSTISSCFSNSGYVEILNVTIDPIGIFYYSKENKAFLLILSNKTPNTTNQFMLN